MRNSIRHPSASSPTWPLLTSQSCQVLVTAPLTQSVMSCPRQVISKVFHSPAGLTREAVCCFGQVEPLGRTFGLGGAEQVPARAVTGLGLMVDLRIGRIAGIDARVITFLARNWRESPFDVINEIAQLGVPSEPLMAAVALADQMCRSPRPETTARRAVAWLAPAAVRESSP